jgi:hypothetical protein
MLKKADVDYLAMDFLPEAILPSLLSQRDNDSSLGYVQTFPPIVKKIAPQLENQDVGLVTNAGGFNPESCARKVAEQLEDWNLTIASVTGDNILNNIESLQATGDSFENVDTGDPLDKIEDDLVAANAYIGAFPLAEALSRGADIVIAGRAVDPALALSPMIHEFGWDATDYDLLASGLTAGHIMECTGQTTGGQLEHWWKDIDLRNFGYPLVGIESDGEFVVTKPDGTGGKISRNTVRAQIAYEIKDPENYYMPDVTIDLTSLTLQEVGKDRVAISGVEANGRPEKLKVAMLYRNGYRSEFMNIFAWPDAIEKGKRGKEMIHEHVADKVDEIKTEIIGYDTCLDGHAVDIDESNEIVLRCALKDNDPEHLDEMIRKARLDVGAPPSGTNIASSGPEEVFGYWPTMVSRDAVDPSIQLFGKTPAGVRP